MHLIVDGFARECHVKPSLGEYSHVLLVSCNAILSTSLESFLRLFWYYFLRHRISSSRNELNHHTTLLTICLIFWEFGQFIIYPSEDTVVRGIARKVNNFSGFICAVRMFRSSYLFNSWVGRAVVLVMY